MVEPELRSAKSHRPRGCCRSRRHPATERNRSPAAARRLRRGAPGEPGKIGWNDNNRQRPSPEVMSAGAVDAVGTGLRHPSRRGAGGGWRRSPLGDGRRKPPGPHPSPRSSIRWSTKADGDAHGPTTRQRHGLPEKRERVAHTAAGSSAPRIVRATCSTVAPIDGGPPSARHGFVEPKPRRRAERTDPPGRPGGR
jgi:hypothetical protein